MGLAAYLGLEAIAMPSPGQRRIGEARRWALFVLAAAALTLATPNGIGGYVPVIHMMEVPIAQTYIAEWQSTNFGHFDPLELWLLGPIFLGFSTGIRLPVSRLLLVLALIHLALVHTRHADLVAFVAPLAVVRSYPFQRNASFISQWQLVPAPVAQYRIHPRESGRIVHEPAG